MGEEGSSERLPISERNTSQLPRLLCCKMESEWKTLSAADRREGESVCSIIGPSLGHQTGQERGWGPPRDVAQQRLE